MFVYLLVCTCCKHYIICLLQGLAFWKSEFAWYAFETRPSILESLCSCIYCTWYLCVENIFGQKHFLFFFLTPLPVPSKFVSRKTKLCAQSLVSWNHQAFSPSQPELFITIFIFSKLSCLSANSRQILGEWMAEFATFGCQTLTVVQLLWRWWDAKKGSSCPIRISQLANNRHPLTNTHWSRRVHGRTGSCWRLN